MQLHLMCLKMNHYLKSKLLKNEKIILTPHIAGLDSNYCRQLDLFKNNLRLYFEKKSVT